MRAQAEVGMATPLTRHQLVETWQSKLALFLHLNVSVPAAGLVRDFLADLERHWADEDSTWLSASDASKRSGYSKDHLRRMAREKKVVAEQRPRAWWYLAGSLPRKSSRAGELTTFDPADAACRALARPAKVETNGKKAMGDTNVDKQAA